jgi:hypothetical protein
VFAALASNFGKIGAAKHPYIISAHHTLHATTTRDRSRVRPHACSAGLRSVWG